MGIEHGYDVDRVLWLGEKMEKTAGRRLRSEAVYNGRTEKKWSYGILPVQVFQN